MKVTARNRGISSRHWQVLRTLVFARDGRRCYRCGGYADTVDHIVPIAQGGRRLDPANLRPACRHCNCSTGGTLGRERQNAMRRLTPLAPGERRVWAGAIEIEAT
ncbi:MAG TPA: HNH endonuclease [Acidimicrobiales bacterium]|nr:HNH endonuclease [Acidimicrobiales bacterium]